MDSQQLRLFKNKSENQQKQIQKKLDLIKHMIKENQNIVNIQSSPTNINVNQFKQKPANLLKGKLDQHLQKYKKHQEQQMNRSQISGVFNTNRTRNVKKNNRYSEIQQNMFYQSELLQRNQSFVEKIHQLHKQSSQPQKMGQQQDQEQQEDGIFQTPVTTKFVQKNQIKEPEQTLEERLKEFELKVEFRQPKQLEQCKYQSQQNKYQNDKYYQITKEQSNYQQNSNQDMIDFIKKIKNFSKKQKEKEKEKEKEQNKNRNTNVIDSILNNMITNDELVELLEREEQKNRVLVIDCRFDYEFKGGHIQGAINISSPKQLQSCILENLDLMSEEYFEMLRQLQNHLKEYDLSNQDINYRKIFFENYKQDHKRLNRLGLMVVMHCEFSKQRSPQMMSYLQTMQGQDGILKVVLLKKGYEQFVEKHGDKCVPIDGYISMFNKKRQQQKAKKEEQYHQQWGQIEFTRSQSTRNS